ncbi:MAG: porin family protein [Saprospiraceae bacterium]|nr:porin family protein [Saprospiraceae bacterium]
MKKLALLFCFAAFLLGKSEAQRGLRFGFQSSPTWSWLRTSDRKLEGVSSNWGVKLGAMGEYYFANNYALTSGLGFGFNHGGTLQNGYSRWRPWDESDLTEIRSDTFSTDAKLHYRINYVEIPFGLKMRGGSNEDARFKFYAELPIFTLGFVTKGTGDIRGTDDQNLEDINIRDEVKGLSLSWGLGGGIEYEFATSTTLVAGLAFQKQFTDVTRDGFVEKTAGNWQKEDSKATFGAIALKLGIFF